MSASRPGSADPVGTASDAGPGFHFRRAQDRPQEELCEIARCADGWLAGELSVRQWERARRFHESAAKAGREHLEVSLMVQVTACDTEDQWTQARRLLRRDLAVPHRWPGRVPPSFAGEPGVWAHLREGGGALACG